MHFEVSIPTRLRRHEDDEEANNSTKEIKIKWPLPTSASVSF